MREDTREAILLFDAAAESRRHYDLINCLDGLTFGFGNWPQAKFGRILAELRLDHQAGSAFIRRAVDAFEADPGSWSAFRTVAGTNMAKPTGPAVTTGFETLFPKQGRGNVSVGVASDDTCRPRPRSGVSYYEDYQRWLVPVLKRALRDPAVVAVQVKRWEVEVLDPAIDLAKSLGITGPGVYLIAFYRSNPGQIPSLKAAIASQKPPTTLRAGGRVWAWDWPPSHLNGVAKQDWQNLLLWQASCPRPGPRFRIRNRNVAFFDKYLAKNFVLPAWESGGSRSDRNCDPAQVKLRVERS